MRTATLTILIFFLRHTFPQDCTDDVDWLSEFGDCASYAADAPSSNFGFCPGDRGGGDDNRLAMEACPFACDQCGEICNLVVVGREGLNAVINGPYQQIGVKDERPFFIHSDSQNVWVFFLTLQNEEGEVTFQGWVSGGELWTTNVYAFVQDTSQSPDDIEGDWTVWDGEEWVVDANIRAICGCINPISKEVLPTHTLCGSTLCSGSCTFDDFADCTINTCGGCHEIWTDQDDNLLVCETGQCDIRISGRLGFNDVINGVYELVEGERLHGRPYYFNPATFFYLFFTEVDWWIISDEFDGESYYALNMNDARTPEYLDGTWSVFTGEETAEDVNILAECGGGCYGRCDGINEKFGCSCEEACENAGNCCDDYWDYCVTVEGCTDKIEDWVDSLGFVCTDYGVNGWCGDELNPDYTNFGFNADENCCVCDGGDFDDAEDPPVEDLPSATEEPVTEAPTESPETPRVPTVSIETPKTPKVPTTEEPKTPTVSIQTPQEPSAPASECQDIPGWVDALNTDCATYIQMHWCGDAYNPQVAVDGISADEACCGCGGGETGGDDGCTDNPNWTSIFGDCASYGVGGANDGFCGEDSGTGSDTRLARDACPNACESPDCV